jgi:hypothetical protein
MEALGMSGRDVSRAFRTFNAGAPAFAAAAARLDPPEASP